MESNDVAKEAMNEIWGILFNLINMAGKPDQLATKIWFRVMVWFEAGQGGKTL